MRSKMIIISNCEFEEQWHVDSQFCRGRLLKRVENTQMLVANGVAQVAIGIDEVICHCHYSSHPRLSSTNRHSPLSQLTKCPWEIAI